MKKNNYQDELLELTKDKIKLFNIHSFLFNLVWIYFLFFIIWYFYINYDEIKNILSYFYNISNVFDNINKYKEFFIWLIFYLLFLWYIKWNKWLIYESILNQGNFIFPIIIIRDFILTIIPFYLLYLYWQNTREFIFILIIYFLSIFCSILLNLYILIKSDYEIVNEIIEKKVSKFFEYNFIFLKLSSWLFLFYSFFIIYFWIKNWFNFITIIFSHIVFITSYIVSSTLNNWIARYVFIKYNWNTIKKGLIYDRNEDSYFVKEWKDIYVIPKSSVEYIKISN